MTPTHAEPVVLDPKHSHLEHLPRVCLPAHRSKRVGIRMGTHVAYQPMHLNVIIIDHFFSHTTHQFTRRKSVSAAREHKGLGDLHGASLERTVASKQHLGNSEAGHWAGGARHTHSCTYKCDSKCL
jgi:hypothetical protein